MRLIIISNRLPVKVRQEDGHYIFTRSEGGLATGLASLQARIEKHWIGWPGICEDDPQGREQIRRQLSAQHFYPVFLTSRQIKEYYEGYSNSTLWPLCHYFFSYVHHEVNCWQTYREVNRIFCEAALRIVRADDIIWIQDYQLMLLPAMLRRHFPDISIGYFHHIPFPSYELFRILPEKIQLIEGLLGADLIGFHTSDYERYFKITAQRVLDIDFNENEVRLDKHIIHVNTFPMGIDFPLYFNSPEIPRVKHYREELIRDFGGCRIILSVDRLDYSKGIYHRLQGFALFLEKHPEYHGKVSLVMIIVPSRCNLDNYAGLKKQIDEAVSAVNGQHALPGWTPVHYYYRSFPFEELVALYHEADIALVTPLRDGMNLVAKEYIAAKRNKPGVLILSEMAGAALELPDALLINPNDVSAIEQAITTALSMPHDEQMDRLKSMQAIISRQTIGKWATNFVGKLQDIHHKNNLLHRKMIESRNFSLICNHYQQAGSRLIMLDYDGTLVGFAAEPREARPSPELMQLLAAFASDHKNNVVISSGRDRDFLEKWFGQIPIGLAAEHGAFLKENGIWHEYVHDELWNDEIINLIRRTINKTPGSVLEIKRTALVWHYRNVNNWLGCIREQQLVEALRPLCRKAGLQIIRGNKIVEIKPARCSKGAIVRMLLENQRYDFLLAIGDDVTDEDMFKALPPEALTVKIGALSTNARFILDSQTETLPFLSALIQAKASVKA